jgi:hypothetical protein
LQQLQQKLQQERQRLQQKLQQRQAKALGPEAAGAQAHDALTHDAHAHAGLAGLYPEYRLGENEELPTVAFFQWQQLHRRCVRAPYTKEHVLRGAHLYACTRVRWRALLVAVRARVLVPSMPNHAVYIPCHRVLPSLVELSQGKLSLEQVGRSLAVFVIQN